MTVSINSPARFSGAVADSRIRAVVGALALTAISALVALTLPGDGGRVALTALLPAIAAVYVGASIGKGGLFAMEAVVALAFLALALASWYLGPWLLALGFALHGVWDGVHHLRDHPVMGRAGIWYVPLCVVYDLLMAAVVLLVA